METSMNDGLKYHASASYIQTENENDLDKSRNYVRDQCTPIFSMHK